MEHRVEVDGEVFVVRGDGSGTTHCDWVTGPNAGYGVSIGAPVHFRSEGTPEPESEPGAGWGLTEEQLVEHLRLFLAEIDPDTGYLRETD